MYIQPHLALKGEYIPTIFLKRLLHAGLLCVACFTHAFWCLQLLDGVLLFLVFLRKITPYLVGMFLALEGQRGQETLAALICSEAALNKKITGFTFSFEWEKTSLPCTLWCKHSSDKMLNWQLEHINYIQIV